MENVKRICLSGCNNLRDLGGYQSALGISKWHTCYRCDLPLLSSDEWAYLYDKYQVRGVIDLRSLAECDMQDYPSRDERISYYHLPLINEKGMNNSAEAVFQMSMADTYLQMLLTGADNVCKILTQIAEILKEGAVLFHCTAGKDRTGIISYLLLHLCGVEDVDIMADYQVSSTYNLYGKNSGNELLKGLANRDHAWMHSQPEALISLFTYFKEHDLQTFLLEHGMKEEYINILKQELQVKE